MPRYIVLYSAPLSVAARFAQATPDQALHGLKLWVDWAEQLGPALLDPGRPLGNARLVTKEGITPTDSPIIGMSILQANSIDEASDMVKHHHHLHWADACEITLLEEMPIPELAAPPQL